MSRPINSRFLRFGQGVGPTLIILFTYIWFAVLILIPMGAIFRKLVNFQILQLFRDTFDSRTLNAFGKSLFIMVVVLIVHLIFGSMLAWIIAKNKIRGTRVISVLLDLPFAVSPVVAGFMLILMFGDKTFLGGLLNKLDIKVLFSMPAMVIATMFVTIPFIAKELVPIIQETPIEQEESAKILGANQRQIFFKIWLPALKWGYIYGIGLTISRALGEFGAVLVVSGSIINQTETATTCIHHLFSDFQYDQAFLCSFVLIGFSLLLIFCLHWIGKKGDIHELHHH
jgi:sulfate transport system permease protein